MQKELPRITAKQVITVLERNGFACVRQSGSHKIYKNPQDKRVTVRFHAGKILHPKVLRSILKDAEITTEQLRDTL